MASATAVPVSGSKLDNRRVLAALIDLVIVGVGWGVILAAAGLIGEPASEIGAPLVAVMLGWALYYYFACESGSGQTLGKRAMNIRVVRTDGGPAGMREIALRTVLRVIDMQLFFLVGLIVMLGTRERRGRLGDLVGGTMIVSADTAAPAPVAVPAPAVSRVPIAESGPAFEPTPEAEPEPRAQDSAGDPTSPALKELASDVAATAGSAPDAAEEPAIEEPPAEAVAEEPAIGEPAIEEPAVEESVAEEPPIEVLEDQPFVEEQPAVEALEDEPAPDEEPAGAEDAVVEAAEDEQGEVKVRSVETISAIDLVMDDGRSDS
jgi:uncharacterized RDD family membrane protein YckC